MTNNNYPIFYGKILLFGEYCIIHGASAISRPMNQFYGKWDGSQSESVLTSFCDYLNTLKPDPSLYKFDFSNFKKNIASGLHFSSSIPQGYGLGSSAAITAATFDHYFIDKKQLDLYQLRHILSQIESFFHGKSSGLDPLVSFLNQTILVHSNAEVEIVDLHQEQSKLQFYLYNSHMSRNTKALVNLHNKRYDNDNRYRDEIKNLCQLNRMAINSLLAQDDDVLEKSFKLISSLQSDVFSDCIPLKIRADYETLSLKLCGAGGGGYYLGICQKSNFLSLQKKYPLVKI